MGLVLDMPFEDYLAVNAMSATGMRVLSRSPWHYLHREPMVPSRAMLNGTLAHCAQLEPDAMPSRYIVVPDDAPRRPTKAQWGAKNPSPDSLAAMRWWTGFQEQAATRAIVAAEDYAITQAQLRAVSDEPELAKLFATGHGEASVFWIDRATGVYCKARPDWTHYLDANRVVLLDLKAVADDTPEGFSRSVARFGYHRQRAHYIAGFQAATGRVVEDFVFAAVSSVPPVLAVPYRMVDETVQQGEQECQELLQLYAECVETNRWPAYAPSDRMIDLPAWAKRSQEVEASWV